MYFFIVIQFGDSTHLSYNLLGINIIKFSLTNSLLDVINALISDKTGILSSAFSEKSNNSKL
jgi:hypothetical protein